MLNPLIAAQNKLYDIQQNINNALNDSYHKRSTAIQSTQYSNYVDVSTSISGDLSQDLLLTSNNSKLQEAKTASDNLTTMSQWLDTFINNQPLIDNNNLSNSIDSNMAWFDSGITNAELSKNTSTQNINNTLETINSITAGLASTNKTIAQSSNSDNIKDLQFQQLTELSKYIDFTARYDNKQLIVTLQSGQPLVLGDSAAVLTKNNDALQINFNHAKSNIAGTTINGAIGSLYKAENAWQNILNNVTTERNQLAIKTNGLNQSNGSPAAYNINNGSFVANPNNTGDLNIDIKNLSLQSNTGINTTIGPDGKKIKDSPTLDTISAIKIENTNNIYSIYTQSTDNNNWILKATDAALSNAITTFNTTNSNSVQLSNLSVSTTSVSGDSWLWQASNTSLSKINTIVPNIQIGMSRTDIVNNNATLSFNGTTAEYNNTPVLSLKVSTTNTLDGFPNGSTVRVIHSDNTYSDFNVTSPTGPTWENGAIYKYNGIEWKATGRAEPGNSWNINKPATIKDSNSVHTQDLSINNLKKMQTQVALTANSASNQTKLNQTYYNDAKSNWQSVSGVNLDEEAQNLQKTQQWYQALAKTETIKKSFWDTLINSI